MFLKSILSVFYQTIKFDCLFLSQFSTFLLFVSLCLTNTVLAPSSPGKFFENGFKSYHCKKMPHKCEIRGIFLIGNLVDRPVSGLPPPPPTPGCATALLTCPSRTVKVTLFLNFKTRSALGVKSERTSIFLV